MALTENEIHIQTLCSHLHGMVHMLRKLPADQWDWTFAPPAPTPRILARHAWQWLTCDRQHIEEPDALKHAPIPDAPQDPTEMCDALQAETERWETMLRELTPEQMAEERHQFNSPSPWSVRGIVGHMVQHCIYKSGQLSTIYFALGHDGDAPYSAPFPGPIYAMLHQHTALKQERAGEGYDDFEQSFAGQDIPPVLLQKTYHLLSSNASGLPVRSDDSLDEIYHFTEMGFPIDQVINYLAKQSDLTLIDDGREPLPITTVADLVHAVVQMTKDGNAP